jgi:tagaturonate reductase
MILSKKCLSSIPEAPNLILPNEKLFDLPEKVLQFGTGVLLRGLPDFFIHKANSKGLFNGRIVVVKSTSVGDTDAFAAQDGLYTVCIRGTENGENVSQNHVISSVSRVLSSISEWDMVLQCASNPDMQVIISNTTELGITLTMDNAHASPPASFPGKLLAFLYQRFEVFNGDIEKGMVIIPTELIPDNADKLLSIILELALQNGLGNAFIEWLKNANHFCNSLVDRIVPGKFSIEAQQKNELEFGFLDNLMIMSEKYSLWAIQSGNQKVKKILSFAEESEGIMIASDISKFREMKLRLLNGSHTFTCGLATLAGFETVKDAMMNESFSKFITKLTLEAIIPSITTENIKQEEAEQFASKVLDRYRNPFIEHKWLSICTQYSSKMKMRNVALIEEYEARFGSPSPLMSLGMAGHIFFMRSSKDLDGNYYGSNQKNKYMITDENAAFYFQNWQLNNIASIVYSILENKDLWGTNLNQIDGFSDQVVQWLDILMDKGAVYVIKLANEQSITMTND